MKRFHKMVAAVMAVATLATSMVPLSADALSFAENSKFTYDLAVEGTSDDMVKVTFYTTYNPGLVNLSVALKYDQSKLEFVKSNMDLDYADVTLKAVADTPEKGMVVTATGVRPGSNGMTASDYSAPIYFSYYFKIKDASEKRTYDFSSCVITYKSQAENINFSKSIDVNGEYPDETIEKVVEKSVYTRRIGDILPDNLVDLDDAVNLLGIVSFLDSCTAIGAAYTAFLNDAMTADYSYTLQDGTTGTYREHFKDSLYANSVPFAEIADCDQNGRIEKNDADLLITYYAQAASGQNPESLINNELSKVVYADITM